MAKWTRLALLLLAALLAGHWYQDRAAVEGPSAGGQQSAPPAMPPDRGPYPAFLPPEAVATLQAIERGGPFAYDRDGTVFQNRERRLPAQSRGYYREYTVATPGSRDRGARRIITGGQPPEVYYYTDDHYRSFRRVEISR
jgi:guanyl-specific ribonuclease Sa